MLPTWSKLNHSIICSREMISSFPWLHPSRTMKFSSASGRMPFRLWSITSASGWRRLLSFSRSGPRISGRWANAGGSQPSARYTRICGKVELMCSCPRMTSVISIPWSSTTAPKL